MKIRDVTNQRLHNQRLVGAPFETPEEMIRWNVAVQAQDYAGAKWGVGQRCAGIVDADLDRLYNDGAILRTHVMRPTWHFVLPEDIRWLLDLTAPRVHAANASRYRQLELDDVTLKTSNDILANALYGNIQLTRSELAGALQAQGINTEGQRLAHIVMHAELDAVICSGPRRGKQFTYALLGERVPPAPSKDREVALVELTRRYFASHGPATPHDFSWWSGLTVKDARTGIELVKDELVSETIDDTTWWFVPPTCPPEIAPPLVHLLPNYDEYFIGFKNHEPSFDPVIRVRYAETRDFWAAHVSALNGIIVGGWRRKLNKRNVTVSPLFPVDFDDTEQTAFMSAAEEYGRFVGLPVVVESPDEL